MFHREPDLVIALETFCSEPRPVETLNLMIEQQKAAVLAHVRHNAGARAHRFLRIIKQRKQAPGLKIHDKDNLVTEAGFKF